MQRALFVLGFIWAFPVTLIAFIFYVAPLWALGIYKFVGWNDIAFVWHVFERPIANGWIANRIHDLWQGWAGSTLGNIVILSVRRGKVSESYKRSLLHEKEHVLQIMKLGVLQPISYALFWVVIKLGMPSCHPYYDNPWEIAARRRADQLIDIMGLIKKLKK